MNRFEQDKPHFISKVIYLLPVIAFLLFFILFLRGIDTVNDVTRAKQKENLETALSRSITQCYAVEGVYPPSLDYLINHYGLLYDEETFLIDYEYTGSNLRPEVRIRRIENQPEK